jgi:hypothetical protein
VLEKIQPLEEELTEAISALDKAQARLTECEDELAGNGSQLQLLLLELCCYCCNAVVLLIGVHAFIGAVYRVITTMLQQRQYCVLHYHSVSQSIMYMHCSHMCCISYLLTW